MDVAIPVVFPDYLITVDTPAYTVLRLPSPFPSDTLTIPKTHSKVSHLGHAGILLYSGQTGLTKYFEYGRYDPPRNAGVVRLRHVPNVRIVNGHATAASLTAVMASISIQSGQSGRIEGAYIELPPGSFDKMLAVATSRLRQNRDPTRPTYDLVGHSCVHFMRDIAASGGADMPDIVDPRPDGYIEKVRDNFPDLDFNRPETMMLQGLTLP